MPDVEPPSQHLLLGQEQELAPRDDPPPTGGDVRSGNSWVARLAIVGVMIALILLFSGLEPSTFPRYDTFTALVIANGPVLLLAVAVTITLRAGRIPSGRKWTPSMPWPGFGAMTSSLPGTGRKL